MLDRRAIFVIASLTSLSSSSGFAAVSFSKANKATRGPEGCKDGAFLDPRLDDPSVGAQCWSCPKGFVRTLEPVTSAKACAKSASSDFEEAKFKHKWFCDPDRGEFFDPRKGGECWSCPKNRPRRTAYPVTSNKACATKEVFGEKLSKANFEHKRKDCTGGAFFDPRKGGECWKCPAGYTRTAEPVNGKKACAKELPGSLASASLQGHFGCKKGEFFDPRNGGECWSCPSAHPHRTVNRVDGDKACTNEVLGVFAVESADFCKQVISALARTRTEGEKAFSELQRLVDPIIEPVKKPILEQVDKMSDLVGGDELLEETVGRIPKDVVTKASEFGQAVGGGSSAIVDVLLDERICTAAPNQIDQRLGKAAKLPAWMKDQFASFSVGATFTHPTYKATMTVALTWVTNLGGEGGLFISSGLGATSSPEPLSLGFSGMFHPNTKLGDFGLSPVPGISVSVSKGGAFEDIFKGKEELLPLVSVVDGIDVAWSPESPTTLPTLGVSKGLLSLGSGGNALIALTAMSGWDFPLMTYVDGKKR